VQVRHAHGVVVGDLAQRQARERRPAAHVIGVRGHDRLDALDDRHRALALGQQLLAQRAGGVLEHRLVQLELVPVVVDERRAADADPLGHVLEPRRGIAELGEDQLPGLEDRPPRLVRRTPPAPGLGLGTRAHPRNLPARR
jgi:hypothetical protein